MLKPEPEDLSKKKGAANVIIVTGAITAAAMLVIGEAINRRPVTVAGLLLAGLTVTARYRF